MIRNSKLLGNIISKIQKVIKTVEEKDKLEIMPAIVSSLVIMLLLEMLSRHSILDGLGYIFVNPIMFLLNWCIVCFTLSFTMLFRKRSFFVFLVTLIWLGLGITNFVILFFRSTPFSAMDLYLLDNVFEMLPLYFNLFEIILMAACVPVLILVLIIIWRKSKKLMAKYKSAIVLLLATTGLMILFYGVAIRTNALASNFSNLPDAFRNYGFAYCFSNSIFDQGIDEPEDYTPGQIDAVIEKIEDKEKDSENNVIDEPSVTPGDDKEELTYNGFHIDKRQAENPNIIMIQLESFFDVNYLLDFEFSENPVPNFSKLKESYSSGFLTVPSIGAGTANTEFEILSGMNLEYFGAGEYPYKTILQNTTCESISYNLGMLGYNSHAIHNNTGTFYDRKDVYQKLGFDGFSSIEYMSDVEFNPVGWAKDAVLTKEIMKAIQKDNKQDFIYTISVQPHGKYPQQVLDESQSITVNLAPEKKALFEAGLFPLPNGMDSLIEFDANEIGDLSQQSNNKEKAKESASEQTEGTQNSDLSIMEGYKNQLEYYVNQLADTDRFIGDLISELSEFNEPTVVVLFGDHLPSLSLTEESLMNANMYQTEYIIWSNFELDQVRKDLHAYQLTAYVQARLGFESGVLTRYHQRCINEEDYQEKLKLLQYDMLYGNLNIFEGVNPYIEKNIQMGVHPIEITNVSKQGEAYIVEGKNFTQWSTVYIDDKAIETIYLTDMVLVIPYEELKDQTIYVAQVTNGKVVLSQSEPWLVK